MNKNRYFKILLILIGSFLVVILLLYGLLVGGVYWGARQIPFQDLKTNHLESDKLEFNKNIHNPSLSQDKWEQQGREHPKKSKLSPEEAQVLFLEVDKINQQMAQTGVPSICELICQESFSKRQNINMTYENFYKYFKDYPEEFTHDPSSRLLLNILSNYKKIFNKEMFEIYGQIEELKENRNSEFDKMRISNSIVVNFLLFARKLSSEYGLISQEAKINSQMVKLNKSCEAKSLSEIKTDCEIFMNQKSVGRF